MKSKFNKPRKRFDLVRRAFDGKIIKWEQKRLSELGTLPLIPQPNGQPIPGFDHEVWVVTGVFNHRREAFA